MLFVLAAIGDFCYADIFYLKNGREIEGKIINQDEEKIWVITSGGAKIGIDRADIKEIVPKDFVVNKPTKAKDTADAAAKKKQPGKTTYGTVTAQVTYNKGKSSDSQGSQTSGDFSVDGSSYSLTQYRDGKPVIFQRETYNTGALKTEVRIENGIRQGTYRSFYDSGTLKETGFYMDGKKSGIFKEYWPDGKLKSEILYKDDKETGLARSYYENSLLAKEVNYVDGKKDGIEKTYYNTGQLQSTQMYIKGKAVGVMEKYYPSGEVQVKSYVTTGETTEYFKDGKIKSKMFNLENKYIEYDQKGQVLYEGQIPENKKPPQEANVSQPTAKKQ